MTEEKAIVSQFDPLLLSNRSLRIAVNENGPYYLTDVLEHYIQHLSNEQKLAAFKPKKFIFKDRQTEDRISYLIDQLFDNDSRTEESLMDTVCPSLLNKLNSVKASAVSGNGILNRLCIYMALLINHGRIELMAYLWTQFVSRLKHRYQNSLAIHELDEMQATTLYSKIKKTNC
jgi:hypothetical protein